MPYTPPHTFVAQTKAKASEVNACFTAVGTYTGNIPVGDLADGSAGQLIVCNASGVPIYVSGGSPGQILVSNASSIPTAVTLGGAVSAVSSAGAITLNNTPKEQGSATSLAIDGTTWTGLADCSFTPAAGTYLVLGHFVVTSGTSMIAAHGRIVTGGGTVVAEASIDASPIVKATLDMHDVHAFSGVEGVFLQGVASQVSGTASAGSGRLTFIRLA